VKNALHRLANLFRGRDRGTVAITFLLSLPVLLLVVAILVQFALLVNGRLAFERALAAAGRSAVTSLPADPALDGVDPQANVRRAAYLALAPLSPPGQSASSEAQTVADALKSMGVNVTSDYARRFTFAQQGPIITFSRPPSNPGAAGMPVPDSFHDRAAGRVRITVEFPFRLNVPVASALIGKNDSIAGTSGLFFKFTSYIDVNLSDGRAVPASATGQPSVVGSVP
jgi:Flp pilus assembly protein TadG